MAGKLLLKSGAHLLSHAVSSIVPSAVWVLTIVFGMGTGVSPRRISTRNFIYLLLTAYTVYSTLSVLATSNYYHISY